MVRALVLVSLAGLALFGWGYANILADPVVRRANVTMTDWPAEMPSIKVALIGDVHVQSPDMPPARVERLATQVNALRPDLILLAGDLVGDRISATRWHSDDAIAAALGRLRARLGVVAVLGNHDHWRDGRGMAGALRRAGILVLQNASVRRGGLTVYGIDDIHTGNADMPAARRAAATLPGPILALSHSPDVVPRLPDRFRLVLAGHTHCGQIVLPIVGAPASASNYGDRYRCGVIREGPRSIFVTSGLGASVLPLRWGAPADLWLLTIGPANRR